MITLIAAEKWTSHVWTRGRLFKSKFLILIMALSVSYPIMSSIGCGQNNYSILDKTVIFLDAARGYQYVSESQFIQKLSMLDISLRMEKDFSQTDPRQFQEEYASYHKKQFKNWSLLDKRFVMRRLKNAYAKIDSVLPVVLPDTIFLIRTTGKQEFKSFYTCRKAIICPSSIRLGSTYLPFIGYIRKYIERTFIHETFHIYLTNHPEIRDQLYQVIGFEEINSLILSPEIYNQTIHNPDDKPGFYKITLKDESIGTTNDYNLVIRSKYPRWQGYIDFPARLNVLLVYLEPGFLQIKKEGENWTAVLDQNQQPIIKKLNSFSTYSEKIRLTDDAISPEEIAAHLFVRLIESKSGPKDFKLNLALNQEILLLIENKLRNQ